MVLAQSLRHLICMERNLSKAQRFILRRKLELDDEALGIQAVAYHVNAGAMAPGTVMAPPP